MFALDKARLATTLAVVAALLAIATARGWHREHHGLAAHRAAIAPHHAGTGSHATAHACGHHHAADGRDADTDTKNRQTPSAPHEEHGCAICLAINVPTGDGLAPAAIGGPVLVLAVTLVLPPASEPVVAFLPVLWSCGPPARV